MTTQTPIPAFGLFGEADSFPDLIHFEDFSVRAPVHNWRIIPHRHGQMSQLFLVESGWIDATTDSRKQKVERGNFLYVPENCVHEFIFEPGSQGGIFSFPISVIRSIAPASDQVQAALSRPFGGEVTDHLAQVTDLLRDVAQAASPHRTQQVLGLAHTVLSALAEQRPAQSRDETGPASTRLMELDSLIAAHRSEGWTASDYASALAISTGHLSRLCRQATGTGAAGYIEQRTMDEACRLLAFTQLPVSQIGYRLGYNDPSYFSKRFRVTRGATPTDYRARFTS